MRHFFLLPLILSVSTLGACAGEEAWWLGDEEPTCSEKCDASNAPLTIILTNRRNKIRKILDGESLGPLERGRTGRLNVDGRGLRDDTMMVFRGTLHRFDGAVEEHFFTVQPRYISHEAGAANPDGFLVVDLKTENIRSFANGLDPLGTHAGIFRGELVASNELTLEDVIDDDLSDLFIRPSNAFQRPSNYLKDVELVITPNVVLSTFKPKDVNCFGADVVDTTLSNTDLDIEVLTDGFPAGEKVEVKMRYLVPQTAATGTLEHLSDFVGGLLGREIEEHVATATIADVSQSPSVSFPGFRTKESAWGDSYFNFEIEVSATSASGNIFSDTYVHNVTVVNEGQEAIVDAVELCPEGDAACHTLRDAKAADNVVARRNVIEFKAQSQGLLETVTRPIGSCSGGDTVAGDFSDACVAYHEETDTQISASLATELQFELHVNGEAQGEKSWEGGIPGLGSAKVEAAFSGKFKLDADFKASFETSRSWRDHNSLDVIYDPSDTQIQWWRVVTPRVRYLEFGEFNSCGQQISENEVFLTDLRDSRMVLACEAVPSFDTVCHAVEPNTDSVAACNELLINPTSPEGLACSAE
jgi:hypothetical protein